MSGDIQISPHVGELFVKYGVRRQYRSGEVLLEKGALSAQAGFLVKGQLRTFCLGPSGDEISLFYLGPGNLFGSSALVYHAKVMVSVSAISPAAVYLLAADRFWEAVAGARLSSPGPDGPFCAADHHAVRLYLLFPLSGG